METLRGGGLVAFPTETVYGLGADASNPAAVARIFAAKGRPADHPLIVHLGDPALLAQWAAPVPEAARALAARFWPGPLTLILRRSPQVPDVVTGGQDTVGLRMPDHPVALALLRAFGGGVAAPSANRFGHVSPTTAAHVRDELDDAVDLILDGGPCRVGIESTIVDLSGPRPRLLRPGAIAEEAIAAVIGQPLAEAGRDAPRVPGALASHYAPRTPASLLESDALAQEAARHLARGERVAALVRSAVELPPGCDRELMPAEPIHYARELYARLRAIDARHYARILIEAPPAEPAWSAIRDRLRRACTA